MDCMLAVPWVSLLVVILSPRRLGFEPGPFNVGFLVDRVTIRQVLLQALRFPPVNVVPPVLHILLNI
jgi:hypothetical protein